MPLDDHTGEARPVDGRRFPGSGPLGVWARLFGLLAVLGPLFFGLEHLLHREEIVAAEAVRATLPTPTAVVVEVPVTVERVVERTVYIPVPVQTEPDVAPSPAPEPAETAGDVGDRAEAFAPPDSDGERPEGELSETSEDQDADEPDDSGPATMPAYVVRRLPVLAPPPPPLDEEEPAPVEDADASLSDVSEAPEEAPPSPPAPQAIEGITVKPDTSAR